MSKSIEFNQNRSIAVDQPGTYRFKIQGRLSPGMLRRFEGMTICVENAGRGVSLTTLTGRLADQAALHGLIARIRDLGLPLILVELLDTHD